MEGGMEKNDGGATEAAAVFSSAFLKKQCHSEWNAVK
jgi:hypothetical protein